MMPRRQNPLPTHSRQRSNSLPAESLRLRSPSETGECPPTVRPPRNPARRPILGEEPLGPPSKPSPNPETAFKDDHREGEIGKSRYSPSVNALPPKSLVNKTQSIQGVPPPQITTLDRKILQELKQSMLARSAQFTLKNNTKHHPFPPDEVPYPRSYDHKCLDTDVWETMFCEQHSGNITFHNFEVPPTKVLDLGCGSGSWIMACARQWRSCQFVGLDIVPLHPDLGRSELGRRVSWVQANFLESLPFPSEEFDFVHVKRIARGVPEHKWDALFEEIIRVMKPGAVLEMVEEDLYIPGQMMDFTDSESPLSTSSSSGSSEELGQPYVHFAPRPSTSLPDISAAYYNSQTIRRSTSERQRKQSLASPTTSNALPPSLPAPPNPNPPFVFPRGRAAHGTVRPININFKLQNLLPKRSARDGESEAAGERPRKTKKDSTMQRSLFKKRKPPSPSRISPPSQPYFNTGGTLSNLTLRSTTTINARSMQAQGVNNQSQGASPLPSPPVESTSDLCDVDSLQDTDSEEFIQYLTESFYDPSLEDEGKWRPAPNILTSIDSGLFPGEEPLESGEWNENLNIVGPPPPPPKDIPGRSNLTAIPLSPSLSEVSTSVTGLSLSVPESPCTDNTDYGEDQIVSPTSDASGSAKHFPATSPIIRRGSSTGHAPSLSQNGHSNSESGVDNRSITSPNVEIPPNPRQHRLLDVIYTEMHAARSVNLAPVSVIESHIRARFKNVLTRSPLVFVFPPPPGCQHRPEFDDVELRPRDLSHSQKFKHWVDQSRGTGPAGVHPTNLSPLISSFPLPPGRSESDDTRSSKNSLTPSFKAPLLGSAPPRPPRDRRRSAAGNEPGPSRARSSSLKSSNLYSANPEPINHRSLHTKGSTPLVGPQDWPLPDRLTVPGERTTAGSNRHAMLITPVAGGGYSPVRVASDEEERYWQRSDSLFTPANDTKGTRGGDARKKLHISTLTLTRPSTAGSAPPSSFTYKNPNAVSSSPSISASSSCTTLQRDPRKGKRTLTAVERAQLNALSCKKTEADTRSLSLHLRVRVVEILGCSEAMWEWVREFQSQEFEKERKHKERLAQAAKTMGVGGGRVACFHRDRAPNRGPREKADGGQPVAAPRTSMEAPSLASKSSRERAPPFMKTSEEQQSPATKTPRRVGGGRVSYFHHQTGRNPGSRQRANSSSTENSGQRSRMPPTRGVIFDGKNKGTPSLYSTSSSGSGRANDPYDRMERSLRQELLRMTRERFDEVLSWFQFDMDDSIRLTSSMITRTSCAPYSTEPSEQRKTFDDACQKFDAYLQLHPKSPSPLVQSSGYASSSGSPVITRQGEEDLCCLPPSLHLVHPSKRLSRTIRVWIAWKL